MVECRDVSLAFGGRLVLSGCSLTLSEGQRIALTGISGCGKTSLLRVILSLIKPDAGTVRLEARKAGVVFQEPRLLPWRTAAENVNAVLSDSPSTLPEARLRLERLQLADAADLYPNELSGGMQQRVSIARALACRPDLLILDEPFKGFDPDLHDLVLREILASLPGTSLLLTTHSEVEAEALGCTILRYRSGRFL